MKICQSCNDSFDNCDWLCPNCGSFPQVQDSFFVFAPLSKTNDGGFKPKYFERLFFLEARNFWFKVRNQLILWALGKYFKDRTTFLEIGCGTGFVLTAIESQFPQLILSGSEIHVDGLNFARKRLHRATLWQMDARNIPFKNEFDVIGAFDVLEHIDEDEKVLEQMYHAVNPGGGIVLTVPQHPFLWSTADEHACHRRRYTAIELERKVKNAGFTIVRTTSFVSILLPFMMASRHKKRSGNQEFDPFAELELNDQINWVFERILKFEAILIRSGISLPVGGSLLLIAYKPENK